MHFHLPKPVHGWREFAGEVGIIVFGVLIALGFGQLAQSLHDRSSAEDAREAIRAEVRENLWWLEFRKNYEPCVNQMLGQLGDILAKARNGEPTPLITDVRLPSHSKITSLRWSANAQAGRASLFSGQEQRLLGNMYFTTEEFRADQEQEDEVWAKMGFVVGLRHYTQADVHDLAILLAEARFRYFRTEVSIMRGEQWAGRLHLTPANPNSVENLSLSAKPVCRSLSETPVQS